MKRAPIWQFHKELCPEGKVVSDQAELDMLGADWVNSPADFEVVKAKPETYHEHMAEWESKEEKKPKRKKKAE